MSLQDNLEKIKNDFSNLDPENMGSWPLPVKVVCWVLMAIIVIVLSYQFVLKEQTAVLDQEIQKEQTLRTSFESKVGSVQGSNERDEGIFRCVSFTVAQRHRGAWVAG